MFRKRLQMYKAQKVDIAWQLYQMVYDHPDQPERAARLNKLLDRYQNLLKRGGVPRQLR